MVKATGEILQEFRDGGDELTKKTVESYIQAFNLLRGRTEGTDMPFLAARQKYFKIS